MPEGRALQAWFELMCMLRLVGQPELLNSNALKLGLMRGCAVLLGAQEGAVKLGQPQATHETRLGAWGHTAKGPILWHMCPTHSTCSGAEPLLGCRHCSSKERLKFPRRTMLGMEMHAWQHLRACTQGHGCCSRHCEQSFRSAVNAVSEHSCVQSVRPSALRHKRSSKGSTPPPQTKPFWAINDAFFQSMLGLCWGLDNLPDPLVRLPSAPIWRRRNSYDKQFRAISKLGKCRFDGDGHRTHRRSGYLRLSMCVSTQGQLKCRLEGDRWV